MPIKLLTSSRLKSEHLVAGLKCYTFLLIFLPLLFLLFKLLQHSVAIFVDGRVQLCYVLYDTVEQNFLVIDSTNCL